VSQRNAPPGATSSDAAAHLERIYVKLGVENRASAAVKATQALHSV